MLWLAAVVALAAVGLLVVLLQVYLLIVEAFFAISILLVGTWVGANVALILWLGKRSERSAAARIAHRTWAAVFYYSALLQGVVFTVLVFWALAVLLSDPTAPADTATFVHDFALGSSVVAALVFVLGVGFPAATTGDYRGAARLLPLGYTAAALGVAMLIWVYEADLAELMASTSPALLFWMVLAGYGALSAAGMLLMFGPYRPRTAAAGD